MKILLSYTKKHYDPTTNTVIYGHTVGREAQIYHKVLSEFGEVEYADSTENAVSGGTYDLLVSLPRNFGYLTANNTIKRTLCHLNIPEPRYLYTQMSEDAQKIGCKLSDCFRPTNFYHADKFILMGSEFNKSFFVNTAGISEDKIVPIRYGMDDFEFKPRDKNKRTIFLHVATTLGLRKGFYHVVNDFLKANIDAELWCVGKVQRENFWIDFVNKAVQDPRIKVFGWIEHYDEKYKELFGKADFLVFPSWGEGQPGTVMEAAAVGTIPLVSKESCFPYFPLGEYVRGSIDIWHKANNMTNEEFRSQQTQMQQYLIDGGFSYKNFEETVRSTVRSLI